MEFPSMFHNSLSLLVRRTNRVCGFLHSTCTSSPRSSITSHASALDVVDGISFHVPQFLVIARPQDEPGMRISPLHLYQFASQFNDESRQCAGCCRWNFLPCSTIPCHCSSAGRTGYADFSTPPVPVRLAVQ